MVDITTVVLTAIFTGFGVSIGNIIFEYYFKDHFKKLKKYNDRQILKIKKTLFYKRPWLAGLLNFFFWGFGYLYVGRKKGLGVLLLFVWLFIGSGFWIHENATEGLFESFTYAFMLFTISGYLAYDAYKTARERNEGRE